MARTDAGYSGTPLPKKLGIAEDAVVVLIDAPGDFAETLGTLPAGARLSARAVKSRSLTFAVREKKARRT